MHIRGNQFWLHRTHCFSYHFNLWSWIQLHIFNSVYFFRLKWFLLRVTVVRRKKLWFGQMECMRLIFCSKFSLSASSFYLLSGLVFDDARNGLLCFPIHIYWHKLENYYENCFWLTPHTTSKVLCSKLQRNLLKITKMHPANRLMWLVWLGSS